MNLKRARQRVGVRPGSCLKRGPGSLVGVLIGGVVAVLAAVAALAFDATGPVLLRDDGE